MASTNSLKAKPDTSEQPRQLTQSEIASLRQELQRRRIVPSQFYNEKSSQRPGLGGPGSFPIFDAHSAYPQLAARVSGR